MLLRKILFWLAWIPLFPIVYIMCGGGLAYRFKKAGRVRQAVWEKHVLRKARQRESLREYGRKVT